MAECARVLRPGGRHCVPDLTVGQDDLPPEPRSVRRAALTSERTKVRAIHGPERSPGHPGNQQIPAAFTTWRPTTDARRWPATEVATRWVAAYIGECGGQRDRLAVAGDSAGANAAAVIALTFRDEGQPLAAQLLAPRVTGLWSQASTMARFEPSGALGQDTTQGQELGHRRRLRARTAALGLRGGLRLRARAWRQLRGH